MRSRTFQIVKLIGILIFISMWILPSQLAAYTNANKEIPINDGIVQDNEYGSSRTFKNDLFRLYWTINDSSIYIGMVGQTTGWIAIGFDPTTAMLDADIIFGWVDDEGAVTLYDAYSLNAFGSNHPKDVDIEGTDNILTSNGTEESGVTTIEFSRNLSTGDDNDKNIPKSGTIDIIWAIGNSDDFTSQHIQRGEATLTMVDQAETSISTTTTDSSEAEISPGFEVMIFFLATGILDRKKRENRKK
ncbi:MAG: DOMON domain-containing protein [Candidatus Hodarchaeales archaeon]